MLSATSPKNRKATGTSTRSSRSRVGSKPPAASASSGLQCCPGRKDILILFRAQGRLATPEYKHDARSPCTSLPPNAATHVRDTLCSALASGREMLAFDRRTCLVSCTLTPSASGCLRRPPSSASGRLSTLPPTLVLFVSLRVCSALLRLGGSGRLTEMMLPSWGGGWPLTTGATTP